MFSKTKTSKSDLFVAGYFHQVYLYCYFSMRINDYKISILNEKEYNFGSLNPELGIQIGKFNIDRNIIYSKFHIKKTNFNGFEVINRNENECIAAGILYEGESN